MIINEVIVANRMLLSLFRISDPGQSPLVLFQVHFQPICGWAGCTTKRKIPQRFCAQVTISDLDRLSLLHVNDMRYV
jgi:hypothetical protein